MQVLRRTRRNGRTAAASDHQLRDTFAVTHLLNGTSMEDLSQMLSHSSVRITEKYYSPWVSFDEQTDMVIF